ncbi:MAG: endonuclease/exonuclease/phosphatase family protein [Spirochaetes bacterium]|nr:endonuclease/exonuclease/phosphatase family protein [Spirochaetota bacterium]
MVRLTLKGYKMTFSKYLSVLLVLFSFSFHNKVTIMSYNVQNLFDDVYNGTEYKEFDPGRGKWNSKLFYKKLSSVAKVIKASNKRGPDIIALQEVENKNVLEKLVKGFLKNMNYRYIVLVPKAGLAANVGVISRYPVEKVHSYYVSNWGKNPVRNILEVDIDADGKLLYLFNNHWKSKSGGVAVTEISRRESAGVVIRRLREILASDPEADIIVCGDFNEDTAEFLDSRGKYQTALIPVDAGSPYEYNSSSIFLGDSADFRSGGGKVVLYDPWFELTGNNTGSYVYRGRWETPDHILLSSGLFDKKGLSYKQGDFRVMKNSFLLYKTSGYPKRWSPLKGYDGYSDHLPLFISLEKR